MGENIQTIDRVLDIVEVVASNNDGLGVTEIANIVNLPKSTVHRALHSLLNRKYLQKNNDKYSLSYKFLAISSQYYSKLDIRIVASEFVRELSLKTNATVHIAIRGGENAIYIEKYRPFAYACSYSSIGNSIPLYCSSLGKILLCSLDENELNDYYNNVKMIKFTNNTISLDELKKQVEEAKIKKVAFDNGEHEEESFCIGTAIRNFQGQIIASLSISSNKQEMFKSEQAINDLLECAKKISLAYGYEGD